MIRLLFSILCLLHLPCDGQDVHEQKVLSRFAATCSAMNEKPGSNFITTIYAAAQQHFQITDPDFRNLKKNLSAKYGFNDSVALRRTTDRILQLYLQQYFLKEEEAFMEKYERVIAYITGQLCSCVTALAGTKSLQEMTIDCGTRLSKDSVFMSWAQEHLSHLPSEDKWSIQLKVDQYIYRHCPVIYDSLNQPLYENLHQMYAHDTSMLGWQAENWLLYYMTADKRDSVVLLFPQYSRDIGSLQMAMALYDGVSDGLKTIRYQDGYKIFTHTYVDPDGKKILGKTVSTLKRQGDEILFIGFAFIPASGMADQEKKEMLEQYRRESKPPPVQPKDH